MEPVIGIPVARGQRVMTPSRRALLSARQEVLDQVNYILYGHTVSSNTDEPDGPIRFVLDENGDVDVDGQVELFFP